MIVYNILLILILYISKELNILIKESRYIFLNDIISHVIIPLLLLNALIPNKLLFLITIISLIYILIKILNLNKNINQINEYIIYILSLSSTSYLLDKLNSTYSNINISTVYKSLFGSFEMIDKNYINLYIIIFIFLILLSFCIKPYIISYSIQRIKYQIYYPIWILKILLLFIIICYAYVTTKIIGVFNIPILIFAIRDTVDRLNISTVYKELLYILYPISIYIISIYMGDILNINHSNLSVLIIGYVYLLLVRKY